MVIYFYAREHLPVHVHGKHQGRESKAEILMKNGEVWQIKFTDVAGRPPLKGKKLEEFSRLVELKSGEIVSRWTDFFVFHRQIKPEVITRRIR